MNDHHRVHQNEYGQMVGSSVQLKPIHFLADSLSGTHASLQVLSTDTLTPACLKQLWQVLKDESEGGCWTYLPYSAFKSAAALETLLQHNFSMPHAIHYLIQIQHRIVGWVGLLNLRPTDGVIEIGNIYFSHQMKQSVASTEVIYLLLNSCFEQGFRRVEWKCDDLNTPSKRAALRFGFQYEGTFRQDRIYKARNRNTAWFSMLDSEWPRVKAAYLAWLTIDNFDPAGQQKIKLAEFMQQYVLDETR